ncbi:hypothetical protein WICPIJ_003067 [Wickerhamomyces pijperi]|uniref:Uncharacterized protein n=1 Tax=Wickerhamomyces pijperi TaxID=599730 RepID=A0A9P8QAH4_WICPI|nr:hypothetical protein WICPIJ_003067 [Wickerhamomyces pijperi]
MHGENLWLMVDLLPNQSDVLNLIDKLERFSQDRIERLTIVIGSFEVTGIEREVKSFPTFLRRKENNEGGCDVDFGTSFLLLTGVKIGKGAKEACLSSTLVSNLVPAVACQSSSSSSDSSSTSTSSSTADEDPAVLPSKTCT